MAAVTGTNTYVGQGSVGNYKDIVDALYAIEGNQALLFDMSKDVKAKGKLHYWEELKFTNTTTNTAQREEGADVSADTPPTQTERNNITELNSVTYQISSTVMGIAKNGGKAGVKDYYKELKDQSLVELKGKNEGSLLNGTADAGTSAAPTRKMDGLVAMASSIGATAYSTFVASAEATFRTLLQTMRGNGGLRSKNKVLLTSWANKDLIATKWTGVATAVQTMADSAVINADVRTYVSQFGPIAVMGHDSFAANTKAVVFEKECLKKAWITNTTEEKLGTTGLSTKFTVFNEMCLEYTKPSTLGHLLIS